MGRAGWLAWAVVSDDDLIAARRELTADCSRCAALCCVLPAFAASADFAVDKPAGTPCLNLLTDDRCGIHAQLRPRGFPGCVVFDCLGAGQRLTQHTFGGRSWRDDPATARAMAATFPVTWYVEVRKFPPPEATAGFAREYEAARGRASARPSGP